jgi:hypothetical protein
VETQRMGRVHGLLRSDFIPGQPAAGRKTEFELISVPKWSWGRDNGPGVGAGQTADAAKVFLDLDILESRLFGIGHMLPAASAAVRGIFTQGRDPMGGGGLQPFNDRFEVLFFLTEDLDGGDVTRRSAGNEDGFAIGGMGDTNASPAGALHANTF